MQGVTLMGKQTGNQQGHNKGNKASGGRFVETPDVIPTPPTPLSAITPKASIVQSSPKPDPVEVAAKNFSKNIQKDGLEHQLSVASIIGMEPAGFAPIRRRFNSIKPDPISEVIIKEIVADFGPAVVSRKNVGLPIQIAQRLNHKYPSEWIEGERRPTPNPKAVLIARRYLSLFGDKFVD